MIGRRSWMVGVTTTGASAADGGVKVDPEVSTGVAGVVGVESGGGFTCRAHGRHVVLQGHLQRPSAFP